MPEYYICNGCKVYHCHLEDIIAGATSMIRVAKTLIFVIYILWT
uniref:Uncharacterized protein n=1 Tax=Lepeophtheirus salmonis TaxID=72036 RepID=A0A0K2TZ91_LEPSM